METILHLGKFSKNYAGGIETVVDGLLSGLSMDFKLFNLVSNTQFKNKLTKRTGYIEYCSALAGVFARTPFCPTMPYQLKKLYQRYRFSIVHLHLPNPMAHFASEILPLSVKRIVSWHSDVVQQKKFIRIYQPFVNHLLKKTHALIVATPYLAQNSIQIKTARKRNIISIIPYGVDFDFFLINKYRKEIDQIKNQYAHRFLIFALGRHVYYKGFCYLIEAMKQLPKDVILLLGGVGALTCTLKRQVNYLQLEDQVHFLGAIRKENLPAYYHACDVFCLPSICQSEAFGMVQLEAMACKKPVISCDLTSSGNQLNQNAVTGFVVPPRCPNALAKAIYTLYQDPLARNALGNSAYHYAKKKFTLQNTVAQIKAVYCR